MSQSHSIKFFSQTFHTLSYYDKKNTHLLGTFLNVGLALRDAVL